MFDKGVVFRREIDDSVFATINQIEIIPLGMSGDSVGSSVIILLDHHALKMIKLTCKIVFFTIRYDQLVKEEFHGGVFQFSSMFNSTKNRQFAFSN